MINPSRSWPRLPRHRHDDQKGAALIIVLVLIATISTMALALTQTMQRSIRLTDAAQSRDAAFWYLLGAEKAALAYLGGQNLQRQDHDVLTEPWLAAPVVLPVEGGVLTATFVDRSNCFNVNGLVNSEGEGQWVADREAMTRFGRMVQEIGGDGRAAEGLAAAIADFMDTDTETEPGGAEDFVYSRGRTPYRTPGFTLSDITEIRAIEGWSREAYQALSPMLCARPDNSDFGPININTIRVEDAPVLFAAFDGDIPLRALQGVIEDRDITGYDEPNDFLELPLFADQSSVSAGRFAVHASFIEVTAELEYGSALVEMTLMIEKPLGSEYRVVSRRFGGASL